MCAEFMCGNASSETKWVREKEMTKTECQTKSRQKPVSDEWCHWCHLSVLSRRDGCNFPKIEKKTKKTNSFAGCLEHFNDYDGTRLQHFCHSAFRENELPLESNMPDTTFVCFACNENVNCRDARRTWIFLPRSLPHAAF